MNWLASGPVALAPADGSDLLAAGGQHQVLEADRLVGIARDGRAAATVVLGRDANGVGGLGRGHALDLHHVLKLALIEPGPKRGDVAVATVGLHHASRQAPSMSS